jgi:tetratricopeptide (TPR) repeat protein
VTKILKICFATSCGKLNPMNTDSSESEKITLVTQPEILTATTNLPELPGYLIQELVGRGGMGKVYRARNLVLNRTVAIKILAHEPEGNLLVRFRDEARAVAKLQHPNIAQLYESGTVDGRPYFALEFVEGGTLSQRFAGQPQEPAYAARIVEAIARAIQHSHDNGILHRDLKPGNVLLSGNGEPKVTDFGLAKTFTPASPDVSTVTQAGGLTRTGEVLGTPAYMPPEQASGITSQLGPTADVYSLGAILYEALTGRPPFQAPDVLQTLLMVLTMEPVPPRTLLPKLPRDLDTICLKCLEKSPKKRYATAGELAEDLKRFLQGEPTLARPVAFSERVMKWARRKKAQAALVGLSGLFALLIVVASVWLIVTNRQLTKLNTDLEAANTNLNLANAEADKSYTLATSTLDEIVRDLSLRLNGMPQGEALLLDVIARSSDLYRQLREVRPSDHGAAERHLNALAIRSSYETNYGRFEAATRTRTELHNAIQRELTKTPDDPAMRLLEIRLAFDTASSAQAENKADRAKEARAEFIRLVDRFGEQFPSRPEVAKLQVEKHWYLGFDAAARNDSEARIAALRQAVTEARQIANPETRFTFLSSSLSQLGMVLNMAKKWAEADVVFAEVQDVYTRAAQNRKGGETMQSGLADVKVRRAGIAMELHKYQDAIRLYASAEPDLRKLVKDFPLTRTYHLTLAECLFWMGVLYKEDDPALCRKLVEEAIAVMDQQLKRYPDPTDQFTRDEYSRMLSKLPKRDEDK